ncbi:ABC transporter substrate-binding protein [Frondihabitans australicus]|uniref:Carbohydrate ABC transporter substrate-binding protein (CUT1 family) n=1 Tax=Frondihabitans australicus TaxID=386892 RepID=A0A495IAR6_9MICO|nr:extracellular solute-binding protein [Frondihabitans australicus]RKR73103.1 carbohydrate ABC transporter substrate-binding protein (CUT1 family) [Frondihabitans australicus]
MANENTGSAFSRRAFLGGAVGAGAVAFLAACSSSGGSGSGSKTMKFWNMPWGNTDFNTLDKKITLAYKPKSGLPAATYQVIQWANFTQTFSSAVASNTGPAVSSGGGTQAFQYAAQGKIAYADDLISSWGSNGLKADFLPGLLDTMKTDKGYAAVPYNLDMRVAWYSKSLLAKAGTTVPTDWQSYLDTCAALKKIGVYGWGQGSGSGNFTGSHIMVSFMINNGGGLFDENQKANCVTNENIEAMNFMLELVSKGYTDPACATYTSANVQAQWKANKFGFGWDGAALDQNVGGTKAADLFVADPLTGPSGKKGALFFPNNIMMYKNTPSQKGSEAFLTYYYKNMHTLWTSNTGVGLPVLSSIADLAGFKKNANAVKVINEWQPISKTWAAPGGSALFSGVSAVDGTPAMTTFTQSILGGKVTAKAALTTLQNAILSSAS